MRRRVVALLCAVWIGGGCASEQKVSTPDASPPAPNETAGKPATPARPPLCERSGREDIVRDLLCTLPAPSVRSLLDVQRALGLLPDATDDPENDVKRVLLAHSTALSGGVVSELNPRAIVAGRDAVMAFSRGVQQLELAVGDRNAMPHHFNFYLLRFEQACNAAAEGCKPHDLYTPQIESDWLSISLEDDEDLKNTPSDCRQCHQRGRDRPILLMRELQGPWTHFFGPDQDDPPGLPEPSGSVLLRDYLHAKGDEAYANLTTPVLSATTGITLEGLVPPDQPLIFAGAEIMNERWPWRDGSFPPEPKRSATWQAAYAAFKLGEQLAPPYFAPHASDDDKRAQLTAAYQGYRAGDLPAEQLPDFADIFPDDPQTRAEIGLQTEPAAAPADTLIQACGSCHNDVLDQKLSRARFSVALGRMNRAELDLAIARIQEPGSSPSVMPPAGRRQIAPEGLEPLLDYLKRTDRPADDDTSLERAAQLGMTPLR